MPYIGTSPSNGVRRVHTYTATASQTTFTGASSEGVTLSYVDTNYIDVFQNGVLLGSADYTSTSGTSVVLAQGASADDLIVIVVYDVFSVADTVSKTNGGSFDSGVTMSSTLAVTGNQTNTGNLTVNGAFTSQGIDDNANNTAIAIDSNEDFTITKQGFNTTSLTFANTSNSTVGAIKYDHASGRMLIDVHGSERIRIHATGATSFGTTDASPFTTSEGHVVALNDGVRYGGLFGCDNIANRDAIAFVNPNGFVGSIKTNGSSTSYNTSSDHRLKENVSDMTGAIDRVKQLLPKRFNFIADDTDTLVDGFLAHEAQSVVAEAVSGTHNEVDDDGNAIIQGIDQAKLVPLLTGALKEAIAKIEALEARITALENAE